MWSINLSVSITESMANWDITSITTYPKYFLW
jgi:hypothetical protein